MSTEQIINPDAIDALRAVSPDDGGKFLTELIDIFVSDTPPRIEEIVRALSARDTNALSRAAHSIKGSAGNFGAERLSRAAAALEKTAKENDLGAAALHATELRAEYAAVEAALRKLRTP